jgi:hypothetical protein
MSAEKRDSAKKQGNDEASALRPLIYTTDDLQVLLRCGKNTAYKVAQRIGRRLSEKDGGRLVVSRRALDEWLRDGGQS